MNLTSRILAAAVFAGTLQALAEPSAPIGPAEEQLVGHWVLQGVLGGKETVHDVDAEWILNREYVQLHEVSREKKPDGSPAYEAIIYVEWSARAHEYSCLWLDSTEGGGISANVIVHGKPETNKIPFIFQLKDGHTFHSTFTYDPAADAWEWLLEDHKGDKVDVFGHVRLTRKK